MHIKPLINFVYTYHIQQGYAWRCLLHQTTSGVRPSLVVMRSLPIFWLIRHTQNEKHTDYRNYLNLSFIDRNN